MNRDVQAASIEVFGVEVLKEKFLKLNFLIFVIL